MRKILLTLLLLAFVAVPITAVADGAAPAAEPEVTLAEPLPADAPLFADPVACLAQPSEAALELAAHGKHLLCSTCCTDGSTVSCMAPPCSIEPGCYVSCGGGRIYCGSPCP